MPSFERTFYTFCGSFLYAPDSFVKYIIGDTLVVNTLKYPSLELVFPLKKSLFCFGNSSYRYVFFTIGS